MLRSLVFLLLLAPTLPAAAQPVLHVRARTRVQIDSMVRRAIDESRLELTISGRLVDADLGTFVDDGTVAVDIQGPNGFFQIAKPTSGYFEVRARLKPGEYQLRIVGGKENDPDHLYERAPPLERTLDLSRTTPTIQLHAAEEASLAQPSITVEIEALDPGDDVETSTAAPHPIELPVTLLVDGKRVASPVTTDGRARLELPVSALGRPGATATVTARFDGDALRNPAAATGRIRVTTPTQLTLDASATELPWRGSLKLDGKLADVLGPVAGATVELATVPDGRALGPALTDGQGRFQLRLDGGREKPGTLFVEARFAGSSFREPSRSPALSLTLEAPAPHPLGFWLSPLATVLAIGGALLFRKRPWRKLAERRAHAEQRERATATAGLTENRPRLLSTLRPATDHGLSGQVVELTTGHGVPTATVTVTAGAVGRTVAVDEQGRFAVEELPAGPVLVEVEAPGYVPERFRRALPHRGELRAARVTLMPIRERIFATWRAVALPLLPEPRLAETWTPRELVRHVARRRLIVDDLDALTRLVEVACFGPHLPDATVLAEAERLAAIVEAPPHP